MANSHEFRSTDKESVIFVSTFNDSFEQKVQFSQTEYKHFDVTLNSGFDSTSQYIRSIIKDSLASVKSEYEDAPKKKKTKRTCTIL